MQKKRYAYRLKLRLEAPTLTIDFLMDLTRLDKQTVHKVLEIGGVWFKKQNIGKMHRLRNFNHELLNGDYIEFHYDPKIAELPTLTEAKCLYDNLNYGVWVKPSGALSQGNEYSDHTSMLRLIEKKKRNAFLIHRLDREVEGLMLFAYTKDGARRLSTLLQEDRVKKIYRAEVYGTLGTPGYEGEINSSIDGDSALTLYKVESQTASTTFVRVTLKTGRLHQIRRHFDYLGFPLMGDPKYGVGNKNADGLKLWAWGLKFNDPFTRKALEFTLDDKITLPSPAQ
ncbi:MAG: RluA family pseudouridine synthase [Bacteriovoracaceae bacterium]